MAQRGATSAQNAAVRVYLQTNLEYFNLRGVATDRGFRHIVESVLQQNLHTTPNTWTKGAQAVYWLGPDEWLLAAAAGSDLCVRLGESLEKCFSAATPQSGGLMQMRLTGNAAREVLAKGCTIDFHSTSFLTGQCTQTLLAKADVLLALTDDSPRFNLIVRRGFAEFIALWLAHSGGEFGTSVLSRK